jgi:hypothetical protein
MKSTDLHCDFTMKIRGDLADSSERIDGPTASYLL